MSRSNPTVKNPATCFMQWAGGADEEGKDNWVGGKLVYWDKEAEKQIEVELPFMFLVLDELHTITGFNDTQHSGYWSNEVRELNSELVVRTKQGIQARNNYYEIKSLALNGLKYAKSVYIAFYNDEKELVIGNLKLAGAALTAWIEFNKTVDVYKCAVALTGADGPMVKGKTRYFVPIFESVKVSANATKEALVLDQQLQSYLGGYLARKPDLDEPKYATSAEALNQDKNAKIEDSGKTMLADGTVVDDEGDDGETTPAPKKKGDKSINLKNVEF